jgi:hypothetical protein
MNKIKKFVEDAIKNAEWKLADSRRSELTDYVRGCVDGSITAYTQVLIELSSCYEYPSEYEFIDEWITKICDNTSAKVEIKMLNIINHFGPLKCDRCGKAIQEVALSLSGDEEHIYCRKCWPIVKKEVELDEAKAI